MKANAMGGYPIRGEDNFSTHVSNRVKKRGRAARDVSRLPPTILARPQPDRVYMEEHKKGHLDCFRGKCRSSEENNRKDIL